MIRRSPSAISRDRLLVGLGLILLGAVGRPGPVCATCGDYLLDAREPSGQHRRHKPQKPDRSPPADVDAGAAEVSHSQVNHSRQAPPRRPCQGPSCRSRKLPPATTAPAPASVDVKTFAAAGDVSACGAAGRSELLTTDPLAQIDGLRPGVFRPPRSGVLDETDSFFVQFPTADFMRIVPSFHRYHSSMREKLSCHVHPNAAGASP